MRSSTQLALGESTGREPSGCKPTGMSSRLLSFPGQEGGLEARGSASPLCRLGGCGGAFVWGVLGSVGTSLSLSPLLLALLFQGAGKQHRSSMASGRKCEG